MEVKIGTETGTTEAGLVLDMVTNTRAGGADPVRIVQVVLGRPREETTGIETVGVATTEEGQDLTASHALLEGIGTEGMLETRTKRNFLVMMTLLRSSSEVLLWKSKVEVKTTKLG